MCVHIERWTRYITYKTVYNYNSTRTHTHTRIYTCVCIYIYIYIYIYNVIVSYSHARVCNHKCVNLPWWLWKNHVLLGFQGTWRCLPHEGPAGSTRMTVHFFGAPQSWLMPKLVISILMDWCTYYGLIQATISGMHPSERNCTIYKSQHHMMSYAQARYDWTCFIETINLYHL